MNVCARASSPLMGMWLHSWINGIDRKQVAHSPSVQMSSSTDCTVDALLIRWEDRYGGPFLQCRLSFKQYKWDKRECFIYWHRWASVRLAGKFESMVSTLGLLGSNAGGKLLHIKIHQRFRFHLHFVQIRRVYFLSGVLTEAHCYAGIHDFKRVDMSEKYFKIIIFSCGIAALKWSCFYFWWCLILATIHTIILCDAVLKHKGAFSLMLTT